ncbi:MAG: ribosomal protein S18-alanine N-acetyltransferase [Corallococcus sp.]|nr:ribosomal protein S18-alanine N-acetyltransferase [Corallococcus sp.]MCM1359227.1 ribosomal protein S18-alanine N-acetyltransferase [Corallococcus sp.]MCM1394618.1 ribosomal protein S18-alanine N-acetyltransferase [Corallococcus sp.]
MIDKLDFTMQNIIALSGLEKVCFGRDAWNIAALRGEFCNDYSHFFAEYGDDGKIVGYICVRILCGEAQVCNIAVLPEYRRKGIATRLIYKMIDFAYANECQRCELEVNTLNEPAIGVYKKCGFEEVGLRKNFYRRNRYASRDAYTMVLELNK